jgi:hypothetical protein
VGRRQLVEADGVEWYVELADADGPSGPQTVGFDDAMSFDAVSRTVEAISASLVKAWRQAKPSEAQIEFGLELTAKSGKLTSVLVEGGGTSSLKITLTWKGPTLA